MKIDLHKEYRQPYLSKKDLLNNPFDQFKAWLQEALNFPLMEANAAVLATASKKGIPSSRNVLIKEIDERSFIFYTNYLSRKGREIEENPFGSMTIYWKELEKQVTFEGRIEKLNAEKSDRYFATRSRQSQLGAWASPQGNKLSSRKELEEKEQFLEKFYINKEIPRPPYWGGYRLIPYLFIFWQGREHRLSDRFLYERIDDQWEISRIAP